MSQLILYQGKSNELNDFPHIVEFVNFKIPQIQLNSYPIHSSEGIRFCVVTEGKFEWKLAEEEYLLFPNDVAMTCPWQTHGNNKGYFEKGSVYWLTIKPLIFKPSGELSLGVWSGLTTLDQRIIGKILSINQQPVLSRVKAAVIIFQKIEQEINEKHLGYKTRINHLIDELIITCVRHLNQQGDSKRDFPQAFLKLEQTLRANLAHPWSVEEMAGMVGLGTTSFTEKVKGFSGFSPLNYLINIRISEAIKLLGRKDLSLTDIALETGFYSSQHFSSTFKKLTGYTPRDFRKKE